MFAFMSDMFMWLFEKWWIWLAVLMFYAMIHIF